MSEKVTKLELQKRNEDMEEKKKLYEEGEEEKWWAEGDVKETGWKRKANDEGQQMIAAKRDRSFRITKQ